MSDPIGDRAEIDLRLEDPAALEEIELYSELMIVAGASSRRLTPEEIDRALGIGAASLSRAPDAVLDHAQ